MKPNRILTVAIAATVLTQIPAMWAGELNRTILPIPEPNTPTYTELDVRDTEPQPNVFSADETADVGLDNQTPVARGIGYGPEETKFSGRIHKVTIELR